MDDLSEKIADILNDPESMDKVRLMAENLLGTKPEQPKTQEKISGILSGEGLPDISEMQKIMGLLSRLKSSEDDSRTQLLLALKPHLSEERRQKVDSAVKILRMLYLLPLIKESGLLNLDFMQ